jgi:uncharacterized protein
MVAPDRPTPDGDTESWWAAIADHTLTVNLCGSCDRHSLYVRPFCPHCWSEDVAPVPASGRATLYTWSVVHQNAAPFDVRAPYVVAMVDLDEGPRLMTAIEDCPLDALEAGMELVLGFRTDDDGFVVPIFLPAESAVRERNTRWT